MASLPLSAGIGRGRGRGRGFRIRPLEEDDLKVQKPTLSAVEDAIDGCLVKTKPIIDFADRFSDDVSVNEGPGKTGAAPTDLLDQGIAFGVGSSSKPKEVLFNKEVRSCPIQIDVLSINFDQKYAELKLFGESMNMKCKISLHESTLLEKWKKENKLIFKIEALVETSLLSAFEMSTEEALSVYKLKMTDGFLHVGIDIFQFDRLRANFLTSLIFMTVPRLPAPRRHKLGVITNLRESDEIDVVFYEQVWLGLRETIHSLQIEKKLTGPRCQVFQELFREMIEGFNVEHFLAPLNDDWRELHRVKVIGVEFDHLVKVMYIDIGKQVSLHIKNLAIPLCGNHVPELLGKIPPLAVKLRIAELNSEYEGMLRGLRSAVEGRVCYIQTVNDTEDIDLPMVEIFLANSCGSGTVSLADLVASNAKNVVPKDNMNFTQAVLKTQEKKLDGLVKNWRELARKEISSNGVAECDCCKDKSLGSCGENYLPSVYRSLCVSLSETCIG